MTSKQCLARAVVFGFIAVICLWQLGSTPLLETDEGFAANRAASMYRHHTWRLSFDDVDDDRPQFRKPPLLYWTVAALYPVIGRNEWAVRLPVAVASIWACWLLFRINQRYFDEWTALGGSLLFACTPFVLVHMRTAMLELPLLALTLASVYGLAYRSDSRWSPWWAGLAGGAAVLMKGMPGFLGLVVAILLTLVIDRGAGRAWRRCGIALAVASSMFGLYCFAIVPHRYRETMLFSMFVKEGSARTLSVAFSERIAKAYGPIWDTARYLVVLALPGLGLVLWRAARQRNVLIWLLLLVLIAVPVALVGQKQVVPYPRYFLPIYAFLAALAAIAITTAMRSRIASSFLLVAVAALTWFSPTARNFHPSVREMPMPGMQEMASRIPSLVPQGEKIILCSKKIKCHQLLFYGDRAIISQGRWLRDEFRPGAVRHALVLKGFYMPAPLITITRLAGTEHFELVRLDVSSERSDVKGIVLCTPADAQKTAEQLIKEGRRFEPFSGGFYLL